MKVKFEKTIIAALFVGTLAVSAIAQGNQTKFSSFFTDLRTDCTKQDSSDGGHESYFCKGPNGYRIHYFDSATTLEFAVETSDRENSINLASQSLNYPTENRKIEWRLADGKPFAVIMAVHEYKTRDGLIEYPTKIMSRKVVVKGLRGFESIDFEEDGKGANERARALADNHYSNAIVPSKGIEIPNGKSSVVLEEFLASGDEKLKYSLKLKSRQRLIVEVKTLGYMSDEGPVMYGIVTAPNGDSDGQPGGTIADMATIDGNYEIMIAQNKAKSSAQGVRVRVTITVTPAND